MNFLAKSGTKRVVSALLILVCFVVPNVASAWGPGPIAVPQPKVLFLDEEKAFLDEFHSKKMQIISNPSWKETSKGAYILDLPDVKNPLGETQTLQFVMIPQAKEFRFWNLYVQEKNKGSWEYKYKGSPLGYVDHGEGREPKFVTYLNSSSIETALGKLKIAYLPTRVIHDVPPVIDPSYVAQHYPSAMSGIMCQDLIAEKFSKDQHNMIPTVYDEVTEDVKKAVKSDKNYANKVKHMSGVQNAQASLLGPSHNKNYYQAQVEYIRKAREEAFKTTLAAVVSFQHRFNSSLKLDQWMSALTNIQNVDDETASNGRYKTMIKQYLPAALEQVPPLMSVDDKLKAIAEINELHRSINESCKAANASYVTSTASTGTILHGEKPYTQSDRQVMNFNEKNRNARAALEKKYRDQHTPQIKAMIQKNGLSLLYGSKLFQEKVGSYDAEDCFKDGKSGLNEQLTLADVYLGQSDSMKNYFAALDDRIEEYGVDINEYMDVIGTYVVSYPLMIKRINSGLTSSPQDMEELRLSCVAIANVYQDEKMEQYLDYTFMGVAVVAGALSAGLGSAAVLSVMGGITAIEATEAGLDWYDGYQLEMHGRKGLLTGNNTILGALDVVERGQSKVTRAKWDFGLTIVSFGVGDVLGEVYKASKNTIKQVAKNTDVVTKGADEVRHIEPIQPLQPKPVREIPLETKGKVIQLNPEVDGPIYRVAGNGDAAISGASRNISEFQSSKDLVRDKLGEGYQLVHIREGDGVVINPDGKLQNIFVHNNEVHLENIISSKKLGNVELTFVDGRLQKVLQLEDGLKFSFSNPPMSMQISLPDGKILPIKADATTSDLVSKIFETDQLQTLSVSEGLIIRVDDNLALVRADGTLLQGQRAGSDIRFFNQDIEVSVDAANRAILNIQNDVWGNAREWKAVGSADDISQYNLPKLTEDGIPNGYGNINCTGIAFSGDAWLSKKGPLSCALPDARFRSQFDAGVRAGDDGVIKTADDLGLLPTDAPPNAAIFYGSPQEKFKNFQNMHERLMQMPEGGTAIIYQIDMPSPLSGIDPANARLGGHVLNARKEGGKVVYYDFQKRQVSLEPQAIIQTPTMNYDLDVIETTNYHRGVSSSGSLDDAPIVRLYDDAGKRVADYEQKILSEFVNGGRIEFSDGKVFNVKRIFSNDGSYNLILELDDGRLLRLPKTDLYPHGIEAYVNAHKKIAEKGVPLPEIYEVGAKLDYLVYEKVTNDLGIKNFKDYLMRKNQFTKEIQAKLEAEFLEFAKKTSPLTVIGDFKADQIVYSNTRGWVIVDVNSNVQFFDPKPIVTTRFVNGAVVRLEPAEIRRLSNERSRNIFSGQFTSDIDNSFIDDINDAVRTERQLRYP